jgi:hypothetical protein
MAEARHRLISTIYWFRVFGRNRYYVMLCSLTNRATAAARLYAAACRMRFSARIVAQHRRLQPDVLTNLLKYGHAEQELGQALWPYLSWRSGMKLMATCRAARAWGISFDRRLKMRLAATKTKEEEEEEEEARDEQDEEDEYEHDAEQTTGYYKHKPVKTYPFEGDEAWKLAHHIASDGTLIMIKNRCIYMTPVLEHCFLTHKDLPIEVWFDGSPNYMLEPRVYAHKVHGSAVDQTLSSVRAFLVFDDDARTPVPWLGNDNLRRIEHAGLITVTPDATKTIGWFPKSGMPKLKLAVQRLSADFPPRPDGTSVKFRIVVEAYVARHGVQHGAVYQAETGAFCVVSRMDSEDAACSAMQRRRARIAAESDHAKRVKREQASTQEIYYQPSSTPPAPPPPALSSAAATSAPTTTTTSTSLLALCAAGAIVEEYSDADEEP